MRPLLLLLLCMLMLHGLRAQGTGQQLMVTTNLVRLLPLMNGEGLSSSRITCIVQDKQGYIWFGTEDGLNRYNGQTIKVFRHIPGDSNSLSSNSISRMIVDQQGLLWITSKGNGLNCYNPITGTFKVYRHEANKLNSLPSNGVHCLLQSRKGEIWIGADNGGGLIRFDPYRKIFKSYLLWPDTAHSVENRRYNSVQYILEDKDSTLWLGARDGLYHFNPRTEAFKVYRDKPESKDHYLENLIFTIHQDGDDSLWLGYWGGGLKLFNKRLGQYQKTYRYVPQK